MASINTESAGAWSRCIGEIAQKNCDPPKVVGVECLDEGDQVLGWEQTYINAMRESQRCRCETPAAPRQ